jgi:quercetin dioxygenase-like cupin family protein
MSTTRDMASLVDVRAADAVEILGPTIQFLTPPGERDDGPCVMRGTIPPGAVVPLHSHEDPETFLTIAGEVEGLVDTGDRMRWVAIGPQGVFHVPGGAKHAWRNRSDQPAVMNLVSTNRIACFFREVGTPVAPRGSTAGVPPSEAVVEHFLETAARYGYWNATPEENAAVGIALPGA